MSVRSIAIVFAPCLMRNESKRDESKRDGNKKDENKKDEDLQKAMKSAKICEILLKEYDNLFCVVRKK